MPKCANCSEFLSPELCRETEDGLAKICVFCSRGIDSIKYFSGTEGTEKTYSKKEAVEDYKRYINELAEKPNVKKIVSGEVGIPDADKTFKL
jgi:hypothetical protein